MKIKVILKLFIISFLFFSSFSSFSQTKPIVLVNDSSKICNGDIIWYARDKCQLLDRKGNVLYNFPGNIISFFNNKKDILAIVESHLVAYNEDMDILWKVGTYTFHHDVMVTPENKIMLYSNEYDSINHILVRFDIIVCLDSSGKELFKWSTFDQRRYLMSFMMKDSNIFRFKTKGSTDPDSVFYNIVQRLTIKGQGSDLIFRELYHMNAMQVIPENESEKKDTVFRKGNILLSFCNYNDSLSSFIAIVDPVHFKILWHYVQKDRKRIHTPVMLPNGHILVYVNSDCKNEDDSSFIDEINPITKEVVWEYIEKFPDVIGRCENGSCQRLPNGNTLISNKNGYIYEVTPGKKIVWNLIINETKILYRAYLYSKENLNLLLNENYILELFEK